MSTTTTANVETEKSLTCGACKTTVPRPEPVKWKPLWDAGWRWLGSLGLYSCPDCPPVVVVDEHGRHVRP